MFILQKVSARELVQRHTSSRKSATVFLCHIISSLRRQYMCFQNMAERNLLVFCLPHISNESGCGAKTCDNFVYFPRASCLDTHLPMRWEMPRRVSQVHKFTSFTSAQVEMSKHPSCEGKRSCKCIANAIYSKVDIFLGKRLILAQNCQMQEGIVHH